MIRMKRRYWGVVNAMITAKKVFSQKGHFFHIMTLFT